METGNKILWFGAGVVGTILLLRYYNKKKDVKVADLKNENPPIIVGVPTPAPTPAPSGLTGNPITVDLLGNGIKPPIFVRPQNLIPNIYDRGVGLPMYMNATGGAPVNIQQACRCAAKKTPPEVIFSKFNVLQ